jgi:phospholipase C
MNKITYFSILMDTRRDFLKKALMLSGASGASGLMPESISRAMAISPDPNTTYLDAEHIVVLMQENRSFDHCFGTLQGVRGFNDPRRIDLPNGHPVWLQSNAAGETYVPFRFDLRGTKATWMGTTPHSRSSQVDACNEGKYDRWLDAKQVKKNGYDNIPMTLGYYTRDDVPFNYALADAFTVCDQNFCSAMTSTWPNRLFLWSGTIRGNPSGDAKAYIRNDIPYGEARWLTFPEMLEKQGVSWRVYQNDITAGGGFEGEERAWLSNFGCNLLEWFAQYQVRFCSRYVASLQKQVEALPQEIATIHKQLEDATLDSANKRRLMSQVEAKEKVLTRAKEELQTWSKENFEKLSSEARSLYERAFTNNVGDPHYHELEPLIYEEGGEKRELNLPKGDVFYQFRKDVNEGKLPTVSWLVGPEKFSDHPTAPWFGSWYVSEVLDILTKNPEVWKKTIFILTYDENDGYFDHVPPFVAPDPRRPETGKCSVGIDSGVEYITLENELRDGVPAKEARSGPIGLGFRVPMIVASPWSRGGRVCSHVFDHTSVFRFVQDFLNRKTGSNVQENNTSLWRKTVCGHLGMVFQPSQGTDFEKVTPLERQPFIKGIYEAKFKDIPTNYKALSKEEIEQCQNQPDASPWMPKQEQGVRPSCALPYQLYAEGALNAETSQFVLKFEARNEIFGVEASGSPFNLFIPRKQAVLKKAGAPPVFEHMGYRSYAVKAGDSLEEVFPLSSFEGGVYHCCVHGPNGFYREHKGNFEDPALQVMCEYDRDQATPGKLNGKLRLTFRPLKSGHSLELAIKDHAYGKADLHKKVTTDKEVIITLDQTASHGWYDFSIGVAGNDLYHRRFAGRIETGKDGFTDPYMGNMI